MRLSRLKSKLAREIVLLLVLKIALLRAIWLAFFSNPVLPEMITGMEPGRVAAVLLHNGPSPNHPPPDRGSP